VKRTFEDQVTIENSDWRERSRNVSLTVRDFIEGKWSEVVGRWTVRPKHGPRDGAVLYE
jgi:hypothetical protein